MGTPAEMVETAVLVVSELIANAVSTTAHGLDEREQRLYEHKPSALPYGRVAALGVVGLKVSCDYRRVLLEVWDGGPGIPVLGDPANDAECGRGLMLVDSVCRRWGWYLVENGDPGRPRDRGKVVWGLLCHGSSGGGEPLIDTLSSPLSTEHRSSSVARRSRSCSLSHRRTGLRS